MKLGPIEEIISKYEQLAFSTNFPNLPARKKALKVATLFCEDADVKCYLAGAVGYLPRHPEWVREAIWKARQRITILRKSGRFD